MLYAGLHPGILLYRCIAQGSRCVCGCGFRCVTTCIYHHASCYRFHFAISFHGIKLTFSTHVLEIQSYLLTTCDVLTCVCVLLVLLYVMLILCNVCMPCACVSNDKFGSLLKNSCVLAGHLIHCNLMTRHHTTKRLDS